MKIKKSIVTTFVVLAAVSACTLGVFASDTGNPGSYSKNSGMPGILSADHEKNVEMTKDYYINNGREDIAKKIELGEMTNEEYLLAIERPDLVERLKDYKVEYEKKYAEDEEFRKGCDEMRQYKIYLDEKSEKITDACEKLLQLSGLYSDGVNRVSLKYDEEYRNNYCADICNCYPHHKNELSSEEKSLIEEYLNGIYSGISCKNQLTKSDVTLYKLIAKTVSVSSHATLEYMSRKPVVD